MNVSTASLPLADCHAPLVSAEALRANLGLPNVKIFDVRGTWSTPARALAEAYEDGHIPGAIFLDWTQHFLAKGAPLGLASIAKEADARASFAALGINKGDVVVLYDASSHMFAGRIWLALRHWGFDNVLVLDGGWNHWKAQSLPISTDPTLPQEGSFVPTLAPGLKIDIDGFLRLRAEACVADARGAENFAGSPDDPRSGHIPGALNVPFSAVLDPDTGMFLDADTIRQVLDTHAPGWASDPMIVSCGSGYAATVILLALALLDKTAVLFDGSFAVWKQDPDRPVAQACVP